MEEQLKDIRLQMLESERQLQAIQARNVNGALHSTPKRDTFSSMGSSAKFSPVDHAPKESSPSQRYNISRTTEPLKQLSPQARPYALLDDPVVESNVASEAIQYLGLHHNSQAMGNSPLQNVRESYASHAPTYSLVSPPRADFYLHAAEKTSPRLRQSRDPLLDVVRMLREELSVSKDELVSKEQELSELQGRLGEMQVFCSSSSQELDHLRSQNKNLNQRLKALEQDSRKNIDESRQECMHLRTLVVTKETIISEATQTIQGLDDKYSKLESAHSKLLTSFDDVTKEHRVEEAAHMAEMRAADERYHQLKDEMRHMSDDLHARNTQIAELTQRSELATSNNNVLKQQVSQIEREAKSAIVHLEQKISNLLEENKSQHQLIDAKSAMVRQLEDVVKQSELDVQRIQSVYVDHESEMKKLRAQYESKLHASESSCDSQRRQIQTLEDEVHVLRVRVEDVSNQAARASAQAAANREALEKAESEKRLLEENISKLTTKNSELARQSESDKATAAAFLKNSSISLETQLAEFNRAMETLKREKDELTNEKLDQSQQYKDSIERLKAGADGNIRARDHRIHELENELERTMTALRALSERDHYQATEITRLTSQLASHQARAKQLEIGILGLKQQAASSKPTNAVNASTGSGVDLSGSNAPSSSLQRLDTLMQRFHADSLPHRSIPESQATPSRMSVTNSAKQDASSDYQFTPSRISPTTANPPNTSQEYAAQSTPPRSSAREGVAPERDGLSSSASTPITRALRQQISEQQSILRSLDQRRLAASQPYDADY